jgi:hypothetical protein
MFLSRAVLVATTSIQGVFHMPQLTGMFVTLITSDETTPGDPGTDDNMYIGVVGTGGGREFPLASPDKDFVKGATQNFALGQPWEPIQVGTQESFPFGVPVPSTPVDPKKPPNNDPKLVPLDVAQVTHVYLRKTGTTRGGTTYEGDEDGDDAYRLQEATVKLYGPASPSKRVFIFKPNPANELKSVWMGTEFGLVIYLQEERKGVPLT